MNQGFWTLPTLTFIYTCYCEMHAFIIDAAQCYLGKHTGIQFVMKESVSRPQKESLERSPAIVSYFPAFVASVPAASTHVSVSDGNRRGDLGDRGCRTQVSTCV